MASNDQCNRRRAGRCWRRMALAAIRTFIGWPQPRPSDAPGQALIVEPSRFVVLNAGRQNLGFPSSRWRLETLELLDNCLERLGSFHARVRRHLLPGEQKAEEIARRDRLDLGAQPLDRIVVNSCEQAAVAPFFFCNCRRREAAAQGKAFRFERSERGQDLARLETEWNRKRGNRDRPLTFEPAAHDLDQGCLRAPFLLSL